jgi:hypothetical protein
MKQKGTTKSGGQKNALDKFYTKSAVAKACIDISDIFSYSVIIEPAAGAGAFSNQLPNCIALDLDPDNPSVTKQDWFTFERERHNDEKVLVIGNPPFGQQNSLAVDFINHAAKFADRVAFIVPISFKKASVQNRLDKNLHLTYEEMLPENSFTLDGRDYDVKCLFQIWDYKDTKRAVVPRASNVNNLFSFVKKDGNPDASIQRVGGNSGKANLSFLDRSESSNYFIKFNGKLTKAEKQAVVDKLNNITYPSRDYAIGPRSLSKGEINEQVNKIWKKAAK